jgi:hypothetical protein
VADGAALHGGKRRGPTGSGGLPSPAALASALGGSQVGSRPGWAGCLLHAEPLTPAALHLFPQASDASGTGLLDTAARAWDTQRIALLDGEKLAGCLPELIGPQEVGWGAWEGGEGGRGEELSVCRGVGAAAALDT